RGFHFLGFGKQGCHGVFAEVASLEAVLISIFQRTIAASARQSPSPATTNATSSSAFTGS
ncbi:MAG: hypothetical protein LBH76_10585, partial [Propionibacteriaceae bacterium]|nr:hypothetical protein [Propionibacteriaceae bacterium]